MTSQQKQLVRESFRNVREVAGPVALLFYGRLFELDPSLRPLFHQDIRLQGRKLMDMLTTVVDSLDHLEDLGPTLRALGQRHVGYGVRLEHYDTLKSALIWALSQALQPDFYPDVRAAWTAVIDAINTVMKEGASEVLS